MHTTKATTRTRTRRAAALATGLALATAALPSAATGSTTSATAARQGRVTLRVPLWTAGPGMHKTTVRVRYPSDEPPADWDGRPVTVQVRHAGERWRTVGRTTQKPVGGRAASRTRVTFRLPLDGDVQIRAKAFSATSSMASKSRSLTVTPGTPAYDPTALRGGRYFDCWDPVIARNPSRIAYGCPSGADEYGYDSWLYDARTDERERLDTYTDYPDLATGANVAIGHELVYYGETLETYRARRYDLDAGTSSWIAFKRNGKRAREAVDASISANGKRIAYASRTNGIAAKTPKAGRHVYVTRAGSKRSRYVGAGSESQIAAFGRYVVWRNPSGKIKRFDRRTGRKTSITERRGDHRRSPDVSAGGRFVTYSQMRRGHRVVRIYDAEQRDHRTIARGTDPVLADNGRYVAYLGENRRELYVWDRRTATSELITVGPDSDGSGARLAVPDISPNGRWLVAATRSAAVAPDNGRGEANDYVVLFDRRRR